MRRIAMSLSLLCVVAQVAAGESRLHVTLSKAIAIAAPAPAPGAAEGPEDSTPASAIDLQLDVPSAPGMHRAWGWASGFNRADHLGWATVADKAGAIFVEVDLVLRPDAWRAGGRASWRLEITRQGDVLSGAWSGTCLGIPGSGKLHGRIAAPPEAAAAPASATFVPIAPGEHPRLLLRRSDLPAVAARLRTPLGQAVRERLMALAERDAAASGLLHVLDGDAVRAQRALEQVRTQMAPIAPSSPSTIGGWGDRLASIAIAYDCCRPAWSDADRTQVRDYLVRACGGLAVRPWEIGRNVKLNDGSHWFNASVAGAAFATIALWGEPGPGPQVAKGGEAAAQEDHRRDLELWQAAGGSRDAAIDELVQLARRRMDRGYRAQMGDGGWQVEGEIDTLAQRLTLDYANAWQRCFGHPPGSGRDVSHWAARYVMATVFAADGSRRMQGFGWSDGRSAGFGHYLRSLSICPPSWRPALVWAANHAAGLGDTAGKPLAPADVAALVRAAKDAIELAPLLVDYPADETPWHPNEVMPRCWIAPTHGGLIVRSGWEGGEEIIAQFAARQAPSPGYAQGEAGCFQIWGLGHAWAAKVQPSLRGGSRWLDNVVMFPDTQLNIYHGLGRVVDSWSDPAAAAAGTTVDLADVYRGRRVSVGDDPNWRTRRMDAADYDSGVSGLRAFAADVSGRCGAPGLFAVVDRIAGGGPKLWLLQRPTDPGETIAIDPQGFTITRGESSLRAVIVAPQPAQPRLLDEPRPYVHAERLNATAAVRAIAIPVDSEVLVVMTLAKGGHPPVAVDGGGLGAVVRVGGRVVRFDGGRLRIDDR